jgi:cellobiose phosphorylase
MPYGHFDDERREYVITRADTPLPWINYLGYEDYFGVVSNTGGGYSFYRDARLRRLIRYRHNNAPLDLGGRCLYLRDDSAKRAASVWSPTGRPMPRELDQYECRHGMGYTSIRSRLGGVQTQVRYFVPPGDSLEIWEVTVSNQRRRPASLSLFAAVEFCLWDALEDATNFQRNLSVGEVEVEDGVIYHKSEYRERRNHFAFFATSAQAAGFDTQREAFLGAYRGWESPAAVEAGCLSNSMASGWQPIGALHTRVQLDPGQSQTIVFLLGYHENPPEDKFDPPGSQVVNKRSVGPVIERYRRLPEVERAFAALRGHWDGLLGKLQVTTPDPHTNRMVNIWNAYQSMVTFNLSRSASYFESGISRGMGFRDSNQDVLGFVHLVPERTRRRILDLAATQLPSGGAYHQYQPLTGLGNNDIGSGFNDDPLWLVLSTAAYLRETGDWSLLDQPVPYDHEPGSEEPLHAHLRRSIRYTLDRLGPQGLPLIGRADWNDCLNLNCFSDRPGQSFQTTTNQDGKTAESVFIAGLFILAAQELAEIAACRNLGQEAGDLRQAAQAMERAVWSAGWDGQWFRRAYDNAGRPVGSQVCDEGQIFIEPQGICVMAGLGLADGRAQAALDSVALRLATPHGIMLLQPAYRRYYLHLGEISSYPPGYKENAGIFCHTNPWIMIAEARLGRGDRAHDYYLRINPSAREPLGDLHRCEPYVYSQMIAGRDAPVHGQAKNSWLTGTAAWNYVAITQWILGIRPTLHGLEIAPVMPGSWDGFEAERCYRGVRYRIQVERVGPGNQVQLQLDGRAVPGTVLPLPTAGTQEVRVMAKVGGTGTTGPPSAC